jgi:integrase
MRQGELLALRWPDIDIDQERLNVRATLQNTAGGPVFAEPKTSKSRRSVRLSRMALAALKQQRVEQAAEQLLAGQQWHDIGLVFPNEIGRPMVSQNLLRRWWYPLLESAGVPRIRFHDARHTMATIALSSGAPLSDVSRMLGHSRVSTTADVYSHVLPDSQRVVVDAIETAIGG